MTHQPRFAYRYFSLFLMTLLVATPCAGQTAAPAASSGSQALGQGTGNSGGTQTFFESQMLAYGALDQIAAQIATDVCADPLKGKHVVLFDTTSFLTVQQYRSFKKEADVLTSLLTSFAPPDPNTVSSEEAAGAPSLQVAEGIFTTLATVIGASTADKNTTFPISDVAVAMSLSQHLTAQSGCAADVTYPRIALAQDADTTKANDNLISGSLNKLFTAERAAAKKVQEEENRTKDRDNGIGGSSGGAPGSSQSAELSNAFSSPLQVVVKDVAGNSRSGVQVAFIAPSSGASANFTGGTNRATVTTNGSGLAAANATANSIAGTYTVTATVDGLPGTATFTLTNTSAPPASIAVAGTPASASPASPPALPSAPPRSVMGSDYLALTGATGLVNQFLSTYGLPSSTSPVAPLGGVLAGAQLMTLLNKTNPDTYIVFWEASAAGGTQRDRKNLITNVFTGDWISYSGGVVLSFGMIDARTGTLVAPVVHRLMSPYTTIAAPPDSIANPIRHGSDLGPLKKAKDKP